MFQQKIQNILNCLSSLIPQFNKSICVNQLNTLPDKITDAIVGNNILRLLTNGTIHQVDEDDLYKVMSLRKYAFCSCRNLSNITLPNNITSIGEQAFANTEYYNNTSNWENDTLYIGNCIIKGKTALSGELYIKPNTSVIADSAFVECRQLTRVIIPNSVITIGRNAFNDCTSLTEIDIPDSVRQISDRAFHYCSNLTSVEIGNGVKTIGESAFEDCGKLYNVKLGNSVEVIGKRAFFRCHKLTSIRLPASVKLICTDGLDAGLFHLYLHATTPPVLQDNALTLVVSATITTKIHIPKGSIEAYKSATNWSKFSKYFVEDIEI